MEPHKYWSNALPPRLTVTPGDTVTVETLDSSFGRVAREIRTVAQPGLDPSLMALIEAGAYPEPADLRRGHPLTGPIAVTGAKPGDTLAVEVVRIEPAAWGFTTCHADPEHPGLLNECLESGTYHHIWDLRDGKHAVLRPGVRVPIAPFCGVMGVAPAEPGEHSTIPPGRHGGNMDVRHLTAGSTLFLPVQVPDALLSVGDAHAAQGDGEVSGTGIEMSATVTLRVDLSPERRVRDTERPESAFHSTWAEPWFLTSGEPLSIPGPCHVSVGSAPDLYEAARLALRGTIDHLRTERGLSAPEAYVLASACVDLKLSQLVDLPNYTVSAYLPLRVFE